VSTVDDRTDAPQQRNIDSAIAILRGELARSDGKASLLLALTGAGLAALLSAASGADFALPVIVTGSLAATALLAATVILLLAVRPQLRGAGWPTWHRLPISDLTAQLAAGQGTEEVRVLATLARRKFTYLRAAVDCALTGLFLLTLAAVLSVAA
jgi:hypothetical protein